MIRAAWLAASLVGAAGALPVTSCARAAPITSCDDPLRGVWRAGPGQPWMILDHGARLEAYPLFDDSRPAGEADPAVVIAPRAIDLERSPGGIRGEVKRRYMRGADGCVARTAVRLTACAGAQLELVVSDPVPPIAFAPCTWGRAPASRTERWRRD